MVREGLAQASRVFTIHCEGEVYKVPIDCRDVHTLRELIALAVPTPPHSSCRPSFSTAISRSKQKELWVNSCICSFGGQRLSLATATEVAPTVLEVAWAAHHRNSGRITTTTTTTATTGSSKTNSTAATTAVRESAFKRRRSCRAVGAEDDNDNASNMSDDSTEDERGETGPQRCPYWRPNASEDDIRGKKNKNNESNEEENDSEDDNADDSEANAGGQSNHKCHSVNSRNAGDDDADNNDDDDDDDNDNDDGDSSIHTNSNSTHNVTHNNGHSTGNHNGYDNDAQEVEDDRCFEVVIPVIVGGVVRLINTESRDKSHQWTVYVRGLFNETRYLEHCIESVCFLLDPSFTPSERLVTSPPFELTEVGWGEFVVNMRVQLRHYPRPIQVMWNSSSSASSLGLAVTTSAFGCDSDIKMAAALLSTRTAQPLAGFTRGPVLSPLVDVLSRYSFYGNNNKNNNNNNNNNSSNIKSDGNKTDNIDSSNKNNGDRLAVVKVEVKREQEEEATYKHTSHNRININDKNSTTDGVNNSNPNDNDNDESQSSAMPMVSTLGMCPGVVMLSHHLRFSHRPRRAHCIPPLGRPYEREEHIGYTLVQAPVVTEHYDEIVVPDPPIPLQETLVSLPEMLRFRVATVKAARVMAATRTQHPQQMGPSGTSSLRASDAFNPYGVSCWKYIMEEGPADGVLAEAYLDSVAGSTLFTSAAPYGRLLTQTGERQEYAAYGVDPAVVLKPGRGRRKLTGAEIDLAALKSAKKGLIEAIENMRREIALRQATHIYRQYI